VWGRTAATGGVSAVAVGEALDACCATTTAGKQAARARRRVCVNMIRI